MRWSCRPPSSSRTAYASALMVSKEKNVCRHKFTAYDDTEVFIETSTIKLEALHNSHEYHIVIGNMRVLSLQKETNCLHPEAVEVSPLYFFC